MGQKKDREASEEFFRRNESEEVFVETGGYSSEDAGRRQDSIDYSIANIKEVISKRHLEGRFFYISDFYF